MIEALRLCCVILYGVGPTVALQALLRRRRNPSAALFRTQDWRRHVPTVLLPFEWLLPPVLIFLEIGDLQAELIPLRLAGFALGIAGAALLVWASIYLGRFFVHEAAVLQDHALVTGGPYRLVRHPVYSGYLALLLGTGIATLNLWLLLLWPVSLIGIIIQAGSEEELLRARFGAAHECYVGRTGHIVPRLWRNNLGRRAARRKPAG